MIYDINLNKRKATTLVQDDYALTFLRPFSDEHSDDHLFVMYEDAYGDTVSGMMHKKTIQDKYSLADETIIEIFKELIS